MKHKKDYKQGLKYIEQVLFNDWDPIGINDDFATFDEYDSYAPEIASMWFNGGLTEDVIVEYLLKIETQYIGLSGDKEKARKVAKKLVSSLT